MNKKHQIINTGPILFAVLMISICGIVYELIIGAISSYLLGDSVKQYSITIGLFMSAMGVGSALSKRLNDHLFDKFVIIELSLGALGGFSAFILFFGYAFSDLYHLLMYFCVIIIGILVGLEIPILTRIIEQQESNLKSTLANVLSFDYIGGLIGSLAFPMILLPSLGHMKTAFLVGIINVSVAMMLVFSYRHQLKQYKSIAVVSVMLMIILVTGFFGGDILYKNLEDNLYRDRVIYSEQTKYQKIVTTKYKDEYRLFLDGNLQFCSADEYRYHEALVHPAMSLAASRENVLILGGGDGMALREVLKYDEVEKAVLVDIDQQMVEYCRTEPFIKGLNQGALDHPKATVLYQDAYQYLQDTQEQFDVIIVDMPDPNNESINKLYTNLFYRLVYQHLDPQGMAVVQSTSPLHAKEAFWCINTTIASEGFVAQPYHINVPSFGEWGFNLVSHQTFDINEIQLDVATRYLNPEAVEAMFALGEDCQRPDGIQINTINRPVLIQYYQKATY